MDDDDEKFIEPEGQSMDRLLNVKLSIASSLVSIGESVDRCSSQSSNYSRGTDSAEDQW
jgi:hypothetical protein